MAMPLKDRLEIDKARDTDDRMRSLTPLEIEWKHRIYDRLLEVVDLSMLGTLENRQARAQIVEVTQKLFLEQAAPLGLAQRQLLARCIEDEVLGLGPIEPLLGDPTVSDIRVNAAKSIYVERRGRLEPTSLQFHDDAHLM